MRNKRVVFYTILFAVFVCALLGVSQVYRWYYSPGVHLLGSCAHLEVSGEAYIIEGQTGEVLCETFYMIWGEAEALSNQKDDFQGSFRGYVQVEDLPVDMSLMLQSEMLAKKHDSFLDIYYSGTTFVPDGDRLTPTTMDTAYWVYCDLENPEKTIILVTGFDGSANGYYVVPAESETDAVESFNFFLAER